MEDNNKPLPLVSAGFIVAFAVVALLIGLAMFTFRDVNNTWDFLVPVVTISQLVVSIFLYSYKKWALYVYTVFLIVFYGYIYYFYRNDVEVALKTIGALSLPLILVIYIWLFRRNRFN